MTHRSTISDLTLERYRLAELPADEAAMVSSRADTDPGVRARLAALARSDAEIREQYPDEWLARAVTDRIARGRPRLRATPGTRSLAALAGACAVILAAALWGPGLRWHSWTGAPASSGPGAPAGADRIKGDPAQLVLHRKVGSGSELLTDGEAARRGDLVRVAYRTPRERFGVIVSIDGRGVVTRHLPVAGATAALLQPGAMTLLDAAYELDDAPRWERFFLITGETTFDVQMVVDAARGALAKGGGHAPTALPLPPTLEQSSFLLRKTSEEGSPR
jgi:hypothetical protein